MSIKFNVCIFIVFMNLHFATAQVPAQDAPEWYFGYYSTLKFEKTGVVPGRWLDTNFVAPGQFFNNKGVPQLLMTEFGCFLPDGRKIETDSSGIPRLPPSKYNAPYMLMYRKPGSPNVVNAIQSFQYWGQKDSPYYDKFYGGSLAQHSIDMNAKDGKGAINWLADTLVFAHSQIASLFVNLQVAASQVLTPHPNGRDLWLIVPMVFPSEIWSFLITPYGIDTATVVKSVSGMQRGFSQVKTSIIPVNDYVGEVKISPDGRLLAVVGGIRGRVALYDFDASTGLVSNDREFADYNSHLDDIEKVARGQRFVTGPYGVEFSSDSKVLYHTHIQYNGIGDYDFYRNFIPDSARGELSQYDITLPTADEIRKSKRVLVPMSYENRFGGLQLAPDGKIYIAQRSWPFVSRIENPNVLGNGCGFNRRAVELLPGTLCGEGFPFIMASTLGSQARIVSQDVCAGDTMRIPLAGGFVTDSVKWNFGDLGSADNIGYGRTGTHYYNRPGSYVVEATIFVGSDPQPPIRSWVYVHEQPTAVASVLPGRACEGDTVQLIAKGGATTRWYAGTKLDSSSFLGIGNPLRVAAAFPGTYTCVVETLYGCKDTAFTTVQVLAKPVITLNSDTVVCVGSVVTLSPSVVGAASYTWTSQPANTTLKQSNATVTFTASAAGTYTLTATGANGCITKASIRVSVTALPNVVAAGDTLLCTPGTVRLSATGARQYRWTDSQNNGVGTDSVVTVAVSSTQWFRVTGYDAEGCGNTDSVLVRIIPDVDLSISGETLICNAEPVTLTCNGAPAASATDISWYDMAGNFIGKGLSVTVQPTVTTSYWTALPARSECNDTARITVRVGRPPTFTVTPTDTSVCVGDSVRIVVSDGSSQTVIASAGSQSVSVTRSDSVGCTATNVAWVRGFTPDAIRVQFQDTTIVVGSAAQKLQVSLRSNTDLRGALVGPGTIRLNHVASALKINQFTDAASGQPLSILSTNTTNGTVEYEVATMQTTIASTEQPYFHMTALPLVSQDTITRINIEVLDIPSLGLCFDSTSKGGQLTLTGCGLGYRLGTIIGAPSQVTIFPNPTQDELTLSYSGGIPGTVSIQLVNAMGEVCLQQNFERKSPVSNTDQLPIHLGQMSGGIYRLVLTSSVEILHLPVVVVK